MLFFVYIVFVGVFFVVIIRNAGEGTAWGGGLGLRHPREFGPGKENTLIGARRLSSRRKSVQWVWNPGSGPSETKEV